MDKIKQMVEEATNVRHSPILIYGGQGSGKTSLLKSIYRSFESWFSCRVLRIVRFISATPRSSYCLELLRIICQQICIALKLPEGFLPKDASFDPLYVNNWFQSLLRSFEDLNLILVIFIDDLHLLNPLDSDVMSTLNWLPMVVSKQVINKTNLNTKQLFALSIFQVHIICTTGAEIDTMRLTPVQKEKLKNSDYYIELPAVGSHIGK